MKQMLLLVAVLLCTVSFGQNQNANPNANDQWKTNGNIIDTNKFIGTKNDRPLILKTDNSERLRISPDGKVGVGTSNPQTLLDVNGEATFRDKIYVTGLDSAQLGNKIVFVDPITGEMKIGDSGSIPYPPAPVNLCSGSPTLLNPQWSNGPNKIYSYCPQVYVGIGTDQPNYHLDVQGIGNFNYGIRLGEYHSFVGAPAYIEGYALNNAQNRPLIRIQKPYNGTDRTVFLVESDGGIYCTSARVRVKEDIPIPDFVFKKDYQLMPLNEVKEFVEINSHLPGIPSEAEIREEGLSLEEMQLKLLQKVEELTLYMIELKEENAELKKEIETLKTH